MQPTPLSAKARAYLNTRTKAFTEGASFEEGTNSVSLPDWDADESDEEEPTPEPEPQIPSEWIEDPEQEPLQEVLFETGDDERQLRKMLKEFEARDLPERITRHNGAVQDWSRTFECIRDEKKRPRDRLRALMLVRRKYPMAGNVRGIRS